VQRGMRKPACYSAVPLFRPPRRVERFPSQLKIFAFDRKQICVSSLVCVTLISAAHAIRFPRFARNRARQKSRNCVCVSPCRARSLSSFFPFFSLSLSSVASLRACVHARVDIRATRGTQNRGQFAKRPAAPHRSQFHVARSRVNSWRKLIQDNYRDETLKHINCGRLPAFVASRTRRFPLARWPRWRTFRGYFASAPSCAIVPARF